MGQKRQLRNLRDLDQAASVRLSDLKIERIFHDRDTKFTESFHALVKSSHIEPLKLPARSPNLKNAYAERWVKSVKDESLSKLVLFGEKSLRRALYEYLMHSHTERNHQGKDNVLLFSTATKTMSGVVGSVYCRERIGGCSNITMVSSMNILTG